MNETDSSDAELIHAIVLGSQDAFVELYRRWQHDVYRFAYAMAKSGGVAEDVTQDVFLNLLQNARRFDPSRGTVRAWLFGCARHAILDRLRSERRWVHDLPDEGSEACQSEQRVLEQQRLGKLHAAIVDLPFEYREAIVLCELEEMSYAEAAVVLACPIGTVRSRLHRARALLVARLRCTESEDGSSLLGAGGACS